jgi:hypothetical protein
VVLAGYDDEVAYLSDTAFEELSAVSERAAAVLDAEERLWPASAADA